MIENLRQKYEENPNEEIALNYAKVLFKLSIEQRIDSGLQTTVDRLKSLSENHSGSDEIALRYAKVLFNLSIEQTTDSGLQTTVDRLKSLSENHPGSDEIALAYAKVLVNLSIEQRIDSGLQTTVDRLKTLSENHPGSDEIALAYAKALVILSIEQRIDSGLQTTVDRLKTLSENHPSSDEIALEYAMGIGNLLCQEELENRSFWIGKLGEQLQLFYLNQGWVDFIKWLLQFQIEEEILQIPNNVPWSRLKQPYLEELLDSIFYYKKGKNLTKDEKDRQIAIFWEVVEACYEQLSQTKYALFQNWLNYNEDEKLNLFQVYRLTRLLKFKLAIKKFKKGEKILQVGHYTKRDKLDVMVGYREDKDKPEISDRKIESKSRLYNANYMNDTQEGILLDKALGLSESDKLQPSSWYLMSLTNNHDNLSMWSQYGGSGEGVCIVLRNDSFKELSDMEEMDSFTAKKNVMELSKDLDITEKVEERKQDTEKDELYRICYLKDCKVIQSDLFEEDDVIELQKYLDELSEVVAGQVDDSLQAAVNNCLEEIRYLFKSADYAYESEVRILRYVSESDRKNVKYDSDDSERRLYIERKEPMQIEKVIFGPKFANADFATPYIQWVDKTIQFERSKIHFR